MDKTFFLLHVKFVKDQRYQRLGMTTNNIKRRSRIW